MNCTNGFYSRIQHGTFKSNIFSFISFRSSRPEVFYKKGVLRNFVKFTGKHLCLTLFFNKVFLLEKRPWHKCFPVNFAKFLRTPFFIEHLWWLLLFILNPERMPNQALRSKRGRGGGTPPKKVFVDVTFFSKSHWSAIFERSNQKCTWKLIFYTSK